MLSICLFGSAVLGQPWAGSGTPNDPYLIYDANDMQAIGADPNFWDAHFKLMADIDLSGFTGTEFNIIGNSTTKFTGVFDGNSHTISNFTYSSTGTNHIGLFGYVSGKSTEVKNLGLVGPDVDGGNGDYVGALAGLVNEGSISGCYVESGSVNGAWGVGGLIGNDHDADILNCYANSTVEGTTNVGGLVGYHYQGRISCCYSAGSIRGYEESTGGLVGYNGNGRVSHCYSIGPVEGKDGVGGLVGTGWYSYIAYSYATGNVSAIGMKSGGLLGEIFAGQHNTVISSFWDVNTTGQADSYYGGTGLTTAEMQDVQTFLDAGWDFVDESDGPSDVWAMPAGGGYPILWWQLSPWPALPSFSGGTGTPDNPHLIATASELNSIGHNPRLMTAHFRVIDDIDLAGVDFYVIGSPWLPFSAVFDSNGHEVFNFAYDSNGLDFIGLFGSVSGENAEIRDLGLIDPNVNAGTGNNIGAMAGYLTKATLRNCYVDGSIVKGGSRVGGLVGLSRGTIRNCYAVADVEGVNSVGCLVGENILATISRCYATGTSKGTDYVGTLVGYNNGRIQSSYALGTVTATGNGAGVLAGVNRNEISNSYARGSVSGDMAVGGLAGVLSDELGSIISRCYCSASVTGNSQVGGLVGLDYGGSYAKCFWNTDVSPDVNGIGNATDPNVIGESTANMQTESTFTSVGWDFVGEVINGPNDIWDICEGTNYPKLAWQIPLLGDFVCPDGVEMRDFAVLAGQWQLEKLSADVAPDGGDGVVNFVDWAVFADGWQNTTDINDLAVFVEQWLQLGAYCADIAPDGGDSIVNWFDLAALVENWLAGL